MRYSYSALVLVTFTIGQVVAGPVKHAHQHLHKKHDEVLEVKAQEKRDWQDVNFATVLITYSKGQTWGDATSVAPAAVPTTPAVAAAAPPKTTAAPAAPATSAAAAAAVPAKAAAAQGIDSSTPAAQTVILTDADRSRIAAMGAQIGSNAVANNGAIWIGTDGPFTSSFANGAGVDIIITCWGPSGSWVNAVAPFITHSLGTGSSFTLSFASGTSGACSAVYGDTQLVNGQVSNTWFEFTFGAISVFDVSREVNMQGHSVSLVGDICTSDMDTCVFKCSSGNVCTFGYELDNCTPGSQQGAEYGLSFGAPSGGCRLGSGTHVSATFS